MSEIACLQQLLPRRCGMVYFVAVQNTNPLDAPAALVVGIGFFAFGLTMILRPDRVRAHFDRFSDSWHPYQMPSWGLRFAGVCVLGVATLFFYVAYISFNR
jgi:hypothetical protein